MKNKKPQIRSKIIFIHAIAIAIACMVFYIVIPYLLNYSPDTINTEFDKQVSGGLYYYQQILLASISIISVVSLILFFRLKDIDNYFEYMKDKKKYKDKIESIKKICLSLPSKLQIIFIFLPLILSIFVLFLQTSYLTSSDFKLMLLIFILSTITISICNTFTKKILSKILIDLENTSYSGTKRSSISSKLLFQIIPILAVCIVFTYLFVSAANQKDNANLLANLYTNKFKAIIDNNVKDLADLEKIINNIELNSKNDILFITDNTFKFKYQSGELSDFFKKYTKELSSKNNLRVYDYYGTSGQGILFPVHTTSGDTYYLGASYTVYSNESVVSIASLLAGLGIICSIILYAFASDLSKNLKEVTNSLQKISKDTNSISNNKLYITSSDEIGDLVVTYNKIQELTMKHLNQIHDNQNLLIERERLASLGQLIGGIAHNLKTPIMSIAGASEGIKDLVNEFDASIGNPIVNDDDFHAIAGDMREWLDKINSYTEYMSDILTAVKGQAVNLSEQTQLDFTIGELFKRVNILMKHELKQAVVYLNMSMKIDEDIIINGDVNSMVQVINNMISNSIQAYDGKPEQQIDLIAWKNDNNKIVITVKDYGPGLPDKVKNKLFKEMITTKGKNGTGLGLYMSYSTIRAHFNGDITVESEEGNGTTFNIILP